MGLVVEAAERLFGRVRGIPRGVSNVALGVDYTEWRIPVDAWFDSACSSSGDMSIVLGRLDSSWSSELRAGLFTVLL